MSYLVLGLLLFLGIHSIRIVADGWRMARVAPLGENRWKGLYSLASSLGLGLVVWGYGLSRAEPVVLWVPPGWTRHLAALLTLPAFILIAAAYVPGSRIKAAVGHPMVAGVKVWAIAHLLSNGNLADVLLFGAFLIWETVAVNPEDTKEHRSTTPPQGESKELGYNAVGIVREVGPEVRLFRPGDAVWYAGAIDRSGSNAEFQRVVERIVGRKPATLTPADAAALTPVHRRDGPAGPNQRRCRGLPAHAEH